jgi:hypothetical protein
MGKSRRFGKGSAKLGTRTVFLLAADLNRDYWLSDCGEERGMPE